MNAHRHVARQVEGAAKAALDYALDAVESRRLRPSESYIYIRLAEEEIRHVDALLGVLMGLGAEHGGAIVQKARRDAEKAGVLIATCR